MPLQRRARLLHWLRTASVIWVVLLSLGMVSSIFDFRLPERSTHRQKITLRPQPLLDDLTFHNVLVRPELYRIELTISDAPGDFLKETSIELKPHAQVTRLTHDGHFEDRDWGIGASDYRDRVHAILTAMAPHGSTLRTMSSRQLTPVEIPTHELALVPFEWKLTVQPIARDNRPWGNVYHLDGRSTGPSAIAPLIAELGALQDSLEREVAPSTPEPGLLGRLRIAAAEHEGHWVRIALQRPVLRAGMLQDFDERVELRTQNRFREPHTSYYLSYEPEPNRQIQQTNLHEVLADYLAPLLADEIAFESHLMGPGLDVHRLPRDPASPAIVVQLEHWWMADGESHVDDVRFAVDATRDPELYPAVAALFTQMEQDTRGETFRTES